MAPGPSIPQLAVEFFHDTFRVPGFSGPEPCTQQGESNCKAPKAQCQQRQVPPHLSMSIAGLELQLFAVAGLGPTVSEVAMVAYISCPKLACLCMKTYVRFETALSTAKKHTRCPPKAAASCTQSNRRDRSQSNEKEDTGHMYRGVQRETNLKLRQADMFCLAKISWSKKCHQFPTWRTSLAVATSHRILPHSTGLA